MSSRNPTPAVAVACLITTWSILKAQVAIPEGMPFIPGVNQPQIHHPVIPKDFRAIDFEVGPTSNRSSINASVAEGFNTNLDLDAFELPFFERGMGLDEADITLGPLGINFQDVRTSVLFSDNINMGDHDEEDGTLGIATLGFSIIFQPFESLHLMFRGDLVALPFEKDIGLNGFGLQDPTRAALGLSGGTRNLSHIQTLLAFEPGDWDIELMEDFAVEFAQGSNYLTSFQSDGTLYAWDPVVFDEVDSAGRYQFGAPATAKGDRASMFDFEERATGDYEDMTIFRTNTAGVTIGRTLPTETDLKVSYYRRDRWTDNESGTQQDTRLGGRVLLNNKKENLRFKPFATYKWINEPRFSSSWNAGIRSELTDHIHSVSNIGQTDGSTTWRIALRHQLNLRTLHAASFRRQVDVNDITGTSDQQTIWDYRLSKVIAPRFNIDFILRGTESEIVDASPAETDEYMFYGLGLTKSFTQSLNWTTTTGLKVQENPAGKNDHSADIDNRLTLRAWDAYEFLLSHRWRERVRNSRNPSEGSRENLIIFQVNRSL
ncbi:MAG: hypothetical protein VW879_02870 [Opitutae bacterium]